MRTRQRVLQTYCEMHLIIIYHVSRSRQTIFLLSLGRASVFLDAAAHTLVDVVFMLLTNLDNNTKLVSSARALCFGYKLRGRLDAN